MIIQPLSGNIILCSMGYLEACSLKDFYDRWNIGRIRAYGVNHEHIDDSLLIRP
ncbi:hypothetical protein HN911_01900 [Candidatus Bathyarchaeota archaeon]|nr:hypothetical protein [Candidatus Bathyarchaeota archaeon]